MATFTAEILPDAGAPQVGLVLTGVTVPDVFLVETTWDDGESWHTVRGGQAWDVAGAGLLRDFIPALNVPIRYRVTSGGGEVLETAPLTVQSTTAWLQDPLDPRGAVAVQWSPNARAGIMLQHPSFDEMQMQQVVDLVAVGGQWVASVGPRMAPTAVPLNLRAVMQGQGQLVKAMSALLKPAGTVVVRGLPEHLVLDPVATIVAPDLRESADVGGISGRWREWQMTVTQVRGPSLSITVPWWTYEQVKALYAGQTYTEVKASKPGATYLDWKRDPTTE